MFWAPFVVVGEGGARAPGNAPAQANEDAARDGRAKTSPDDFLKKIIEGSEN